MREGFLRMGKGFFKSENSKSSNVVICHPSGFFLVFVFVCVCVCVGSDQVKLLDKRITLMILFLKEVDWYLVVIVTATKKKYVK